MGTFSLAIATPSSYRVSPLEVISIGAFSGVLIAAHAQLGAASSTKINQLHVRMRRGRRYRTAATLQRQNPKRGCPVLCSFSGAAAERHRLAGSTRNSARAPGHGPVS